MSVVHDFNPYKPFPRVKAAEMLSDRRSRFLEAENARLRATYAELVAANNRLSAGLVQLGKQNNSLQDMVIAYQDMYHDGASIMLKT